MAWIRACGVDDIEVGEAIKLDVNPPIAVFNVGGEFYATDDVCTHAESSLSDGYITDAVVECAYHFAKFDIRTGDVLGPPACVPLATFPVKVENGEVMVDVGDRESISPGSSDDEGREAVG